MLGESVADAVLAAAVLRSAGALLLLGEGWWWCLVLGVQLRLLPAIGLTLLLTALGAGLGELCFRAVTTMAQ